MIDDIKVSVIIPVYNAEKYLKKCLDSVLKQSLSEVEIICVDDGSIDDSMNILNEYVCTDKRIRVLHQNHCFAGNARNLGMKHAKGKYLVFWDSDDYFFKDALKHMYAKCEADEADICICGGKQYYDSEGFEAPGPRYLRKNEIPEQLPFSIHTHRDHIISITVEAPWNKMFRKSFVERTGLQFHPTRNANDVFFVISALCLAERVTLVNKALVCYRKNKTDGLVATISEGLKRAVNEWLSTADFLRENNSFPERSFANRCLESILYLLNNTENWQSFKESYLFLQNGNLEKLGIICSQDDSYYYIKYHNTASKNLYSMTPEEFSKWIGREFFLKESAAVAKSRKNKSESDSKIKKLNNENNRLKDEADNRNKDIEKLNQEIKNNKLIIQKKELEAEALKSDLAEKQKNNDVLLKQINDCRKALKEKDDELRSLKQSLDSKKKEISSIKKSVSFKMGRGLTYIPRALKKMVHSDK